SGYSAVCLNIALIETDVRQKLTQRLVTVPERVLFIESAAQFIDECRREQVRVRQRQRVIHDAVLCEAQADERTHHRVGGGVLRLNIVDRRHQVLLGEIVVQTNGSEVAHEVAGKAGE